MNYIEFLIVWIMWQLIHNVLIFAAVAKVFQYVSDKAADFVSDMPEDNNDLYYDEEYEE